MRVVYSPAHLAHDVVTETVTGPSIPANEVAERAERIRRRSRPTAGFTIEARPSTARTRSWRSTIPACCGYLEEAWPRPAPSRSTAEPDRRHVPDLPDVRGMSPEFVASRPETGYAGGRAGWWGLDTANPLVAGTYGAARAAVDVALTTADLVPRRRARGLRLCRPPGHHAARSMAGGYCFFNNAAIAAEAIARATGERVAILDVDYHHGNGTQQIFWRRGDVLYVSLHARPERQYPFFLGTPTRPARGGERANLNLPLPAGTDDEAYLAALDRGWRRSPTRPAT
jgi:acetoin utilization deacetylase AcuC-like enzyme